MTENTAPQAFWMIEETEEESRADTMGSGFSGEGVMVRGLGAEDHRAWARTEVVVDEGYGCPYNFGNVLREMIGDDKAIIFRYWYPKSDDGLSHNAYLAMSNRTGKAAFYDPDKRTNAPVHPRNIDYFAAVDALQ